MTQKDNFTKRYFNDAISSNYNSSVKNYIDVANQPTATDAVADAIGGLANQPAQGETQRGANAIAAGFAGGLKSYANDQRQEKLSPLMEQVANINSQAALMQAQMQEQQQTQMQSQQFLTSQSYPISELAKASTAGDTGAMNNISRGILQSYKQSSGDPMVGDFDHYHDGTIYFTNNETGEKSGVNISQLIAQSGIQPEEVFGADAPLIMSSLSPGYKGQYQNEQALMQQQLEGGQAKIENTQADTELKNANAGKANLEGTPEYQKLLQDQENAKARVSNNVSKIVPEIAQQYQKNNEVIDNIEEFKTILENSYLAGGSGFKAVARFIAKHTGYDESVVKAENAGQFYFEWMSENTKGALSDRDIELYRKTFASIDKNKKSSLDILDRLEKKLTNQNLIAKRQLEAYEKDPSVNLHSLDMLKTEKPEKQPQKSTTVANDREKATKNLIEWQN